MMAESNIRQASRHHSLGKIMKTGSLIRGVPQAVINSAACLILIIYPHPVYLHRR